jgi:hypothetical protein
MGLVELVSLLVGVFWLMSGLWVAWFVSGLWVAWFVSVVLLLDNQLFANSNIHIYS